MAPAKLTAPVAAGGKRTMVATFVLAYVGLWAVTLATALATRSHGLLRDAIASVYGPELYPHQSADAAAVGRRFADNATRAWPLLFALAPHGRWAWATSLVDRLLAVNLIVNAALVGGAIGLAGAGIAPYLVHLPVEWAALALTVSGWLATRRGASRRTIVGYLGGFLALLLVAAVVETYAVPHI